MLEFEKKLGFGAMRLPVIEDQNNTNPVDIEKTKKMVDLFLSQGFCYFDTAYVYHNETSENALKEALTTRHPRESYLLADKMPTFRVNSEGDYQPFFDEQLRRCGVDYFDFYLLHNLGKATYASTENHGGFPFISKMKAEGKAKYIGFSFHDTPELLDEILTSHPEVDFVQLQINYADWDRPSVQSGACYDVARKHQKPIIVMEPVKGGGLANPNEKVRKLFEEASPGVSPASWAVRYAASLEGVLLVLSGMTTLEQVRDNTGYMKDFTPLSSDEYAVIEKAVALLKKSSEIPCTSCQYCVDGCPQRINIPSLFSIYNMTKQFGNANFPAMHYNRQTESRGKAKDCVECGLCESHCPQHIPIIEEMKKVSVAFDK